MEFTCEHFPAMIYNFLVFGLTRVSINLLPLDDDEALGKKGPSFVLTLQL